MRLPIYHVDAFTERLFSGNPAAIVLCDTPLPRSTMQAVAAENNLAETAFVAGEPGNLSIRWFTPTVEVDLCGHATLGAAHVLYELHGDRLGDLRFSSKSGTLTVSRSNGLLWLNFPSDEPERDNQPLPAVMQGTGKRPIEVYRGRHDIMAVFADEQSIAEISPDFAAIARLPCRGLIITAKGEHVDFVSRFFAPQSGIAEDAVTGSAHTTLTPYWAKRLSKTEMKAQQLSSRGGTLFCRDMGDRTHIGGCAQTYLTGQIYL